MHRLFLLLLFLGPLSCGTPVEPVVLHRPNCETCHQPLNEFAEPVGIEEAHPWFPLECVDCHGGKERICSTGLVVDTPEGPRCDGEWVYDQDQAHVSPGSRWGLETWSPSTAPPITR